MGNTKIWIGFCDDTDLWWLRGLKKGFRHCFAVMKTEGQWLSYDPLSSGTEIQVLPVTSDFDVPGWLKKQGAIMIRAQIYSLPKKPAPFAPFTCVEAMKRLLGIHARYVMTPWQLYCYLNKGEKNGKHYFQTQSAGSGAKAESCLRHTRARTH